MAYKKLTRVFDKSVLSNRAEEINMLKNKKNYKLVTTIIGRLKDVLRTNKDLIALSAPQLNYPYRIFCIKFSDGEIRGFVNPLVYKYSEQTHLSREVQLGHNSTIEYIIPRFDSIEMSFQTPVGNLVSNRFEGVVGEIIQQMDDLLNGVMIEDYGLEIIEGFDEAPQEVKEEIIKMYLEHLQEQSKHLQEIIENDKEHIRTNEAIQFMEQAKLGKIELAPMEEKPKDKNFAKEEPSKSKSKVKTNREILADLKDIMDETKDN